MGKRDATDSQTGEDESSRKRLRVSGPGDDVDATATQSSSEGPAAPQLADQAYDAVVLDIEGTTTPLSFVSDTLFPYAREHVAEYVSNGWHADDTVKADVAALQQQCQADQADNAVDMPSDAVIPTDGPEDERRAAVLRNMAWQMDLNRKTTALKQLQGHVWQRGYKAGSLQGMVYPDVVDAFKAWKAADIPVFIYSSGSVHAQKLLFHHSTQGDLLPFLAGHFDTTTGPKQEASSYDAISKEVRESYPEVQRLCFATDHVKEAQAAAAATGSSWHAVMVDRPGNVDYRPHVFPIIRKLTQLL